MHERSPILRAALSSAALPGQCSVHSTAGGATVLQASFQPAGSCAVIITGREKYLSMVTVCFCMPSILSLAEDGILTELND